MLWEFEHLADHCWNEISKK